MLAVVMFIYGRQAGDVAKKGDSQKFLDFQK